MSDLDYVELWLVRHGETVENATGILSGWIEATLSPLGVQQAKALKPKLASVSFDAVYASPLQRTQDTARYAGFPAPVTEPPIQELCFGDYGGTPIARLPQDWVRALYTFTDDFVTPNGENIAMVSQRVTRFVNTLPPGRYLLFCHGGVIRTLARHLGVDKFLENGTALVIDWTHRTILEHVR